MLKTVDLTPCIHIDTQLQAADLTLAAAQAISILEPFGMGNPQPVFALNGVTLTAARTLSDGKHCKLSVTKNGKPFDFLGFGMGAMAEQFHMGEKLDIAFTMGINVFRGERNLQLIIKDARMSVRLKEVRFMESSLQTILDNIKKYSPNANTDGVVRAYEFAKKAHEGQFRKSGEAYVHHPIEVATIMTELEMDKPSVEAALLHDVVEDTDYTLDDIKTKFGEDVALIVDGVTKIGKIHYTSQEEQQIENLRKMFLAMAKDIRVILIKLADRLHNMRTLSVKSPQKRPGYRFGNNGDLCADCTSAGYSCGQRGIGGYCASLFGPGCLP